ncbi:MAG: cohesin domain-containing protein [Bacteroidota bacterium]
MKKLFLIYLMMASSALLFSQSTVTLSLPQIDGAVPGTQVTVPIYVDAIDNLVVGAEIYVEYDPAVLTPVSWQNVHPNFTGDPWTVNLNYSATECFFLWTDGTFMGQAIAPGEAFLDITFDYLGGYTDLNIGMSKGAPDYPEKGLTILLDPFFSMFAITAVPGYVSDGGSGAITWNGSVSSDWFDGANWDGGVVPTGADDVVVGAGMPNDPTLNLFVVAEVNNFQVDAGVILTLTADGYLSAYGTTLFNGAMIIQSDATGNGGSFIENGIDGASTGSFVYVRNTLGTGALGDPAGWHYISSPVSTFDSDAIWDYYMNYYDEATSMWVHHAGSPTIPCTPAPTMGMGLMQGWSVKQDLEYAANGCTGGTGQSIEFASAFGNLYSGAQTFNGTAGDPTGDFLNNWNLIGNPFPATWYYEDMYSTGLPAGWDDAMYMWDDASQNYLQWVGGAGDANDGFVVPTQAVFFHGDGSQATMPMTMDPSELYHSDYSFTKSEVTDLVALKVTGEFSYDNTFIRFLDEATVGFDGHWDAYKLMSGVDYVPALYTHAGDDNLSINSLPATELVHMSFTTGQSGTFTIEATETSDFSHVVLEDTFTGEQTDLLTDSYTFNFSTGDAADRFIVHFTPLGTIENNANNITIYSNENNIYVNVPEQITGDIVVVNMMGQEIVRTDVAQGLNVLPMNDANTYYVVKVVSNDEVITGKVYIQ